LVILLETGAVTPPVGINVYIIKGIDPDIPMGAMFRGIVPFFLAMLVCLVILMVFPDTALFLLSLMK
jgi:C4-dicarboxylate transporter DctM subunit